MRKTYLKKRLVLAMLTLFAACKKDVKTNTVNQPSVTQGSARTVNALADASGLTISGTKFLLNGKQIFFNGINTAWQQGDFDAIGDAGFNGSWWTTEFQNYAANHINLARVWVHCSGSNSPSTNGDGSVTGASSKFWQDMDQVVSISKSNQVYIMPTFWSFDMLRYGQKTQLAQVINDVNKSTYYINNFLIPFVKRYNNEPFIMGYDLCNEPEHMYSKDPNTGADPLVTRSNVLRFFAMCAAAIHQNSSKPVTLGASSVNTNSSKDGGHNDYSNASLQSFYSNSAAYLDFYSPHWYSWYCASTPANKTIPEWMDDATKPVILGESTGRDMNSSTPNNGCGYNITLPNFYNNCYLKGYSGVCAWKNASNDDGAGTFATIIPATNDFYSKYPSLVYPSAQGGSGAVVSGGTYEIVSVNSGKVAEVYGGTGATANATKVQQYTYLNQSNQQWVITSIGSGYYTFAAKNSGRLMEVYNRSLADGAQVSIYDNVNGTNQQWSLVLLSNGNYEIVNRNSGKALDVSGGLSATGDGIAIDQYGYGGGANQQWKFVRVQ